MRRRAWGAGRARRAEAWPLNLLSCPQEDMQQLVRQRVESQLQRESRGGLGEGLGAPVNSGTARTPWVRLPLGRWGHWR